MRQEECIDERRDLRARKQPATQAGDAQPTPQSAGSGLHSRRGRAVRGVHRRGRSANCRANRPPIGKPGQAHGGNGAQAAFQARSRSSPPRRSAEATGTSIRNGRSQQIPEHGCPPDGAACTTGACLAADRRLAAGWPSPSKKAGDVAAGALVEKGGAVLSRRPDGVSSGSGSVSVLCGSDAGALRHDFSIEHVCACGNRTMRSAQFPPSYQSPHFSPKRMQNVVNCRT